MQPKNRRLVTEQTLEDGVENLNGRIHAVETMAGLEPGQVTDAQTASVIRQYSTQTRSALNKIIGDEVSPVSQTATAAHSVATSTAARVDAFEVLTETTPGNVDDATIALHVGQPASLARETVARVVLDVSSNLFDQNAAIIGQYYPNGSGEIASSSTAALSDWIPVAPGGVYTYGGGVNRVTYFNSNSAYLSNHDMVQAGVLTRAVPNGAVWVRLTVAVAAIDTSQMNRGTELLPYEPFGARVRDEFLPPSEVGDGEITPAKTSFFSISSNLFDQSMITHGMVILAGSGTPVPATNAAYSVSAPIPVEASTPYSYNGVTRVTYFDAGGNYLHHSDQNTVPGVSVSPPETSYVRLSIRNLDLSIAQMNEGTTVLSYEPGGPAKILAEHLPAPVNPGSSQEPYLVDTDGLEQIYTAPTVNPYPDNPDAIQATLTDDVHSWYNDLVASHPDYVTRTDLGVSSDGVGHLYAYTFKAPEVNTEPDGTAQDNAKTPIPAALFISGVHGYEKAAVWQLWRFAQALCEEWQDSPTLDAIRWNIEVVIVPVGCPYGYDNSIEMGSNQRTNANGVDIARNFAAGWVETVPETSTYSGTAPLTEPEAIMLNDLMADMADRAVFGTSFHCFTSHSESVHMLWQAAPSELTLNLGKQVISRMSRKWRKDNVWVTDPRNFYGYSGWGGIGGYEGRAFESHGYPGSTFETSRTQYLDGGDGGRHGSRAMTLGYEAIVNYIAMGIKMGIDLKNRA